jgi:multiple antibiotic resistance protein
MSHSFNLFFSIWIKFFFLLTPFFVLSMFLSLTTGMSFGERRDVAVKVTLAIGVICLFLFFFGQALFSIFGITVDSFRIGAGVLLFLSAVKLVQGSPAAPVQASDGDIAVVPLAIPITVGPATIGALLVMGAEMRNMWEKITGCTALLTAIACVGIMLVVASFIERLIGRRGLNILSKLTGLILSALAAQIICTGLKNFLALS